MTDFLNFLRSVVCFFTIGFFVFMINLKPTIMKFGGTSVQDATAFARVASIVTGEKENSPVVVTSAMSKVTDALLFAFELAKKDETEKAIESLGRHFERHSDVAK